MKVTSLRYLDAKFHHPSPKIKKILKNTNGRLAIPALAGLLVQYTETAVSDENIQRLVIGYLVPGYLADDIHLASESSARSLRSSSGRSLSLVFTVVLVTDILLQLDGNHVYGMEQLTCQFARQGSQLHRIQKTTENIMFQTDCGA